MLIVTHSNVQFTYTHIEYTGRPTSKKKLGYNEKVKIFPVI